MGRPSNSGIHQAEQFGWDADGQEWRATGHRDQQRFKSFKARRVRTGGVSLPFTRRGAERLSREKLNTRLTPLVNKRDEEIRQHTSRHTIRDEIGAVI
jgi:hypothetical protein